MVITPVKIDELTYGYNLDGNGNLINNKLNHIDDPVSSSLCNYDIDDQSQDNYLYDAIGNLTKDNAEEIDNIEWNAYGKISKITRTTGSQKSNLEFIYDAMGNRVCKIEKPYNLTSTGWKYTFYVRDASGNIMTTYTKTGSEIENNVLKLDEVMLYGSSRIGTREVNTLLSGLTVSTTTFSRALGLKRYEIGNHLGNVLVTFTDRKYQIQSSNQVTGYKTYIASSQDYYPFGMIMNGRNWNTSGYRFGFNGKENDNEVSGDGNWQDYGMRMYNPRIGRFPSVDPITKKYPELTPFQFASNTPIWAIDLDGLEAYFNTDGSFAKWGPNQSKDAPVFIITENGEVGIKLNLEQLMNRSNWTYGEGGGDNSRGYAHAINNRAKSMGENRMYAGMTTRSRRPTKEELKNGAYAINSKNQKKAYFEQSITIEGEEVNSNYKNFKRLVRGSDNDFSNLENLKIDANIAAADLKIILKIRKAISANIAVATGEKDPTEGAQNWAGKGSEDYVRKWYVIGTNIFKDIGGGLFYHLARKKHKKDDDVQIKKL